MSLLRLTPGFLGLCLAAALAAPAGADQVFSTVSTGPVYPHATPAPYPLGDLYYAPCGWNGNYGGSGSGSRNGHGGHSGNTTLTGERFYPYDIRSNGNRNGHAGNRNHSPGYNCYGNWQPSPTHAPK